MIYSHFIFSSGARKSTEEKVEEEQEVEKEEESEAIKRVLSRLADGLSGSETAEDDDDECDKDSFPSQLNQGRRLDYVLQVSWLLCILFQLNYCYRNFFLCVCVHQGGSPRKLERLSLRPVEPRHLLGLARLLALHA